MITNNYNDNNYKISQTNIYNAILRVVRYSNSPEIKWDNMNPMSCPKKSGICYIGVFVE